MAKQVYDEIQVLRSCAGGDSAAFEAIVSKYQSLVCAITYSAVGQVDKSEELAQQAFINAWQNLAQLQDLDMFKAWLIAITRNVIRTFYRTQKRDIVNNAAPLDQVGDRPDSSPEPVETIISKEQEMIVQQSLERIPEMYREPMVLFYRQQQSTREVAEALDLTEETVRTRLMRGRKMLKEQVSKMVESTLAHTGPGKAFTTMVVASIAGLALTGTTATAGTAASSTGTAATSAASSGLTALTTGITAKILTAAAVVAVTVGAVFAYKHLTQPSQNPDPSNELVAVVDEQKEVVTPEITEIEAPEVQEIAVEPVDTPESQPLVSQAEIVDLPKPVSPEPIECIHAYMKERDQEGEIWVKGDKKWRFKFGDIEKICDGKRVLVLDHRNKQASYSQGGLKQPEEILDPLMIAELVSKNFDPAKEEAKVNLAGRNCIARINPDIESEPGEVVFDVFEPDSNELLGTAWIDKLTAKLNYLEATESEGGLIGEWHYEPIDDKLFSTKVPAGYTLDQGRYISGIVTDVHLNPVTDATVYVTGLFEGPEREIITQTNKEGFFEYELKFDRDDWGIEFPVVIRAVSPSYPDRAAWTCILDPDVEVEKWPDWMPPIDPEVVVTKIEPRNKTAICKSIQALWLQLEPAGSISGNVTNKQGEPIQDAIVNANMYIRLQVNKQRSGKVFTNRFSIPAKTDETGYYKITGIPSLRGQAFSNGNQSKSCSVRASANGYSPWSQYIENAKNSGNTDVTFTEEKHCDFVLSRNGLTIKGRVVDNYGKPLAHYDHVSYMEKGNRSWYPSSRLDSQGRFVIPNAPRADVILIRKETYSESYGWQHDNKTKNLEFMPYPEKEFEFQVPPDVNEFDVGDLVLNYPDITAEIYVVDFEGNPIGFVECSPQNIGSKELLQDRYWKVTDEIEGKCIIENLPRTDNFDSNRPPRPLVLRSYEKTPRKAKKMLERFSSPIYYRPKYPGDYKHYIFELVLPRKDHHQERRMRIFSPEGELLLEEDSG
ncbi:MAG: sigma-70 family RNA polymerase sigma factor [Planctomycetota bacterium]